MKSSHLATTMLLSASMVAGIAFGVPSAGIAADQMAAESVEDAFEMSAGGEVADQNDAAANTSANRTEAADQIDRYDVAYMDDCCYEQLAEQIPAIDATATSLSGGWYALLDDVELSEALTVEGDVHLVLVGDHTLSALEGIRVAKDSKLTLHTQDGATARVLVRKGVLRVLTDEQRAEEEQMIARELEADPEYRFREPQILFVEPCYEVVAGDNEPSTDPDHVFDPDHDPKQIEHPVLARKLLGRDYLVITPRSSHSMITQDGEAIVKDGHYICECCDGWFEDLDGHCVLNKSDAKGTALGVMAESDGGIGDAQTTTAYGSGAEIVTVTFDANGGSGHMDSMEVAAGESFVLPECEYEPPAGMEFSQWSLGKPGSSVSVPASTTIRAWWKSATNKDESSQSEQPQSSADDSTTDDGTGTTDDQGTTTTPTQNGGASTSQSTIRGTSSSQSSSPDTSDQLAPSESYTIAFVAGAAAIVLGHKTREKDL